MGHEVTETVETKKGSGIWINKRTVNENKPMGPEQKKFFAKKYKTGGYIEVTPRGFSRMLPEKRQKTKIYT